MSCRAQFAPAVTGEDAIQGRQCDRASQRLLVGGLALRNHYDATLCGRCQHLIKQLRFAFQRSDGVIAQFMFASFRHDLLIAFTPLSIAQLAGQADGATDGASGLLQAQAQFER